VQPPKTSQTTTKPPEPVTKNPAPAVRVIAPATTNSASNPINQNDVPIVPIRKADSSQTSATPLQSGTPDHQVDERMTVPLVAPDPEKKEK
jgi:hypothetical protein